MNRLAAIPVEIRISAIVFAVAGPLSLVLHALLGSLGGQSGPLSLPLLFAGFEVAVAAALLLRVPASGVLAMGIAAAAALVQLVDLLNGGPWWTMIAFGLLAAAHIYVLVLLNTGPARGYRGGNT